MTRGALLLLAPMLAAPVAARDDGPLETADLPRGYVATDGREPLHLRVAPVAGAHLLLPVGKADATLTVTFDERTAEGTTVTLASTADRTLKVDLYISPDAARWFYTSSCPLAGNVLGMEHWPHPVPHLALANPRWVDGSASACE